MTSKWNIFDAMALAFIGIGIFQLIWPPYHGASGAILSSLNVLSVLLLFIASEIRALRKEAANE